MLSSYPGAIVLSLFYPIRSTAEPGSQCSPAHGSPNSYTHGSQDSYKHGSWDSYTREPGELHTTADWVSPASTAEKKL